MPCDFSHIIRCTSALLLEQRSSLHSLCAFSRLRLDYTGVVGNTSGWYPQKASNFPEKYLSGAYIHIGGAARLSLTVDHSHNQALREATDLPKRQQILSQSQWLKSMRIEPGISLTLIVDELERGNHSWLHRQAPQQRALHRHGLQADADRLSRMGMAQMRLHPHLRGRAHLAAGIALQA
jgi:hypothetical protein